MVNAAVVYESKYGSTKKYAEWIAKALSVEAFEKKSVRPEALREYDTVIYGGGLYAGGISGISLITKNYEALQGKNLVVFTCGLADPSDAENIRGIHKGIEKVFSPDMKKNIAFFHLRGAMDYSRLSVVHKPMMAMMKNIISKKDPDSLRDEDREFLETYGKKVDFTDRKAIEPILDYIKSL